MNKITEKMIFDVISNKLNQLDKIERERVVNSVESKIENTILNLSIRDLQNLDLNSFYEDPTALICYLIYKIKEGKLNHDYRLEQIKNDLNSIIYSDQIMTLKVIEDVISKYKNK